MKESGKTVVSIAEIKLAFEDLILGNRAREKLATWAQELMEAQDQEKLVYEPRAEQKRIWRAIVYLSGVDLRDTPTSYLHDEQNFRDFLRIYLS